MADVIERLKNTLLAAVDDYTKHMLNLQREAHELANAAARAGNTEEMNALVHFRDHTLGTAFDEALERQKKIASV